MKRKIVALILITSILSLLMASCSSVVTEEHTEVVATIVDLEYQSPHTTYTLANEVLIPLWHSARYYVTVAYEDISETFNSRNLYHTVKIGDEVRVTLYSGYDKNGMSVKRKLQLSK